MTDDLSATIRAFAKSGRLNHVSVGFSNTGKWSGSYRGVDHKDGRTFEHSDPVSALIGAITGRRIPEPEVVKPVRKIKVQSAPVIDEEEDLL